MTTAHTAPHSLFEIVQYTTLPVGRLFATYEFYERTFRPLAELAVQNHLMTAADFMTMCHDSRIVKILAYDAGEIVGMAVTTNRLEAWPLVSPAYFAKHFPTLHERHAIWYVGFAGASVPGVFTRLLDRLSAPVRAAAGMAIMDFCANRETLGLPDRAAKYAASQDPRLRTHRLDAQAYWSFSYAEGDRA